MDMIELVDRATAWTGEKVAGATGQLDAPSPCEGWTARQAIDHLLAGQAMFAAAPGGGDVAPPPDPPPALTGDDPAAQYEEARKKTIDAYAAPGALEGTLAGAGGMPAMQIFGIAFCDQLIHGWDLARATGQDTTMPEDLAALAMQLLDGRLNEDSRGPGKNFGPAVTVDADASVQDRLLGYCGRTP
jgi:uncharacterized protein (TIGR03086 family)